MCHNPSADADLDGQGAEFLQVQAIGPTIGQFVLGEFSSFGQFVKCLFTETGNITASVKQDPDHECPLKQHQQVRSPGAAGLELGLMGGPDL